ncbi:MAG: polysaccharide biosynthesis C-terminal domain-containing protein [Suipraeoptans sp.]
MSSKSSRIKASNSSNFLLQGSILAIAGVITKIIGIAYRVPLLYIIGEEGMGYYGIANSIYIVALTLTSYSLPLAVSKLVSARTATGNYKNAYKVFKGALIFAIIAGGIVSLIVFFGADFISVNIMHSESEVVYALRVLSPCIFIVAILGTIRGFFQGVGSMIPTAISQIIEQIVNAAVSIGGSYYLIKLGREAAASGENSSTEAAYGAAGGTLGTVMGAFFALVFVLMIFAAYKKYFNKKIRRDRSVSTESYKLIFITLFATITPVIISGTINNIGDFIDSSVFTTVMSAQGVAKKEYISLLGIYTGTYATLTRVPIAISTALASSFIPSLVSTFHTGTKRDVFKKINTSIRFNMVIVIPCAVGFFALARPILDLLFVTQDNALAANMLRVGALSIIFYCLSTMTNSVLQGIDKMMVPVKNAIIALVIYVVSLCIMLIVFKWGIFSIVLSRIVYSGSISILNAHAIREEIGYVQEVKKTFAIPALASGVMGLLSALIQLVLSLFLPSKVSTVLAICFAIVIYFVVLILLRGITENELRTIPMGGRLIRICKKVHLLKD